MTAIIISILILALLFFIMWSLVVTIRDASKREKEYKEWTDEQAFLHRNYKINAEDK